MEQQIQRAEGVRSDFEAIRAALAQVRSSDPHRARYPALIRDEQAETEYQSFRKKVEDTLDKDRIELEKCGDERTGSFLGAALTTATVVGPLYFARSAKKEGVKVKGPCLMKGCNVKLMLMVTSTAAEERVKMGEKAIQAIDGQFKGIKATIDVVGSNVEFWAGMSTRLRDELEPLEPTLLIKPDGRVKVGVVEECIDSWREIATQYGSYTTYVSSVRSYFVTRAILYYSAGLEYLCR